MIDSFSAAVQCAEEALRDPGGLRFAHVPSLVAFVTAVSDEGVSRDRDCSAPELAAGARLVRLLLELGLRGEAAELYRALASYLVLTEAGVDDPEGAELANALAAVGTSLGLLDHARTMLQVALRDSSLDPLLRAASLVNLAAVK